MSGFFLQRLLTKARWLASRLACCKVPVLSQCDPPAHAVRAPISLAAPSPLSREFAALAALVHAALAQPSTAAQLVVQQAVLALVVQQAALPS